MATKSVVQLRDQYQQDWKVYEERSKVLKFLTYCGERHSTAQIRLESLNLEIRSHVVESPKVHSDFRIKIPQGYDIEPWKKSLENEETPSINFLLFLRAGAVLAFRVPLREVNIEKGYLSFDAPQKVFKIQRRKNVRYEVPAGFNIQVELTDPRKEKSTIKRRIFDISVGGLSFIVPKDEMELYPDGLFVPRMTLTLRNRPLNLSGQVRNAHLLDRKSEAKVGLSFHGLSNADRDFISSYVLSHHVQYLTDLD